MVRKKSLMKSLIGVLLAINIVFLIFNIVFVKYNVSNFSENKSAEDIQSVFGEYQGNWFESDSELIAYLNNNPIDNKYYNQLQGADTTSEMAIIISEWSAAYEREIEKECQEIEKFLSLSETTESIEAQAEFEKLKNASNDIFEHNVNFIYNCKTSTSGYGTIIQSFAAFDDLKKKRTYAFELAEILNLCTDDTFEFKCEQSGQSVVSDGSMIEP